MDQNYFDISLLGIIERDFLELNVILLYHVIGMRIIGFAGLSNQWMKRNVDEY